MLLPTFLLGLVPSLPPAGSGAAPAPLQEVSPQTIEDVEIMRRVLVEALEKASGASAPALAMAFPDVDETVMATTLLGRYTRLGARGGRTSNALGFYLPGAGALFTLELELPLVEVDAPEDADEESGADDLWSRTEREVRSRPEAPVATQAISLGFLGGERRRFALDPAAIRRVEDALLQQLARHGGKLEGLDQDETITVAVRLRPADRPLLAQESRPGDSVDWSAWLTTYGAGHAVERRLVVQVEAGDLGAAPDGAGAAQRLRERARIALY